MFTGHTLNFTPDQMTKARVLEYVWHWFVGSLVLATLVAGIGIGTTYTLARWSHKR